MAARLSLDKAIRAAVLAVPGVADLLEGRVYADEAVPQGEPLPYASLTLISGGRHKSLAGALKSAKARYQVDFFGTKEHANALAELVGARAEDGGLDGFKGTWGNADASAFIQSCFVVEDSAQHGSIDPASAQEARIYYAGFDLKIWFNG